MQSVANTLQSHPLSSCKHLRVLHNPSARLQVVLHPPSYPGRIVRYLSNIPVADCHPTPYPHPPPLSVVSAIDFTNSPWGALMLTLLAFAANLGSTFWALEAAVLKNAALALAVLRAAPPRRERRTAERVTRVISVSGG